MGLTQLAAPPRSRGAGAISRPPMMIRGLVEAEIEGEAKAPPTTEPKPISEFLDSLTKFIPGDILTIYVSFFAFIKTTGETGSAFAGTWFPSASHSVPDFTLFIFLLVATPFWVAGMRYIATQRGTPYVPPVWASFAGMVAFYCYAMAFENVLQAPTTGSVALFGGLLIVVTPVLLFVNSVIARAWPDQAV